MREIIVEEERIVFYLLFLSYFVGKKNNKYLLVWNWNIIYLNGLVYCDKNLINDKIYFI